jgi:hypothetical protein
MCSSLPDLQQLVFVAQFIPLYCPRIGKHGAKKSERSRHSGVRNGRFGNRVSFGSRRKAAIRSDRI